MSKVKEIIDYMKELYPIENSSDFDKGKVGLQFGSNNADVKKVLISLDASSMVIDEAINNNCDLILTHHPFMFSPLLNLNYDSVFGKKLIKVISNKINIAAFHTCYDVGINGMNDTLASLIGLSNVKQTEDFQNDAFLRVGDIPEMSLQEFALKVKKSLNEDSVRVIGSLDKKIKKVGIIGGAGAFSWSEAMFNGCDCFITGEVHYNNAVDVVENNFAIIEISHYAESNFKEVLKDILSAKFKDVEFITSNETNPFKTI